MKKDIFKKLIIDYQQRDYSAVIERDYSLNFDIQKIHTLVGTRRCGKTYLMFFLMNRIMQQHGKEQVLYMNFEDDRLYPLQPGDLDSMLEAYFELYPEMRSQLAYFFFDEIHLVNGWERFVRRVFDTENCRIIITGSSSKLLSKEIATELRGRSILTEVFPLSFKEFLRFKSITYDMEKLNSKTTSLIQNILAEYLSKGGFPEIVTMPENLYRPLLQQYIDLIIYRDIVERYGISNIALLKYLINFCLNNSAGLISYNKLYNDFRSQGIVFARNTIYEYMSHLEDCLALFTIPVFAHSFRKQLRNPRKIFAADTGLKNAVSISPDIGRLYETAAFLHLRRRHSSIFYLKNLHETDFYVPDAHLMVNVAYDIEDSKTYYRELNGLVDAMNRLNFSEAILITNYKDEMMKKDNNKLIKILPLWKWLLV